MEEQNIPIDINTTKLLEWLISRRHVSKDWQSNILKVREKINLAIQDMPENDSIVELLKGQHINYFHCLKIIDILKQTEADTKNLFGRYGSQRMKDWQEIIHLYQRDNLYLAEVAQILIRNVNFELPSLRKQKAKFEQMQLESEKKIKDYSKTENLTFNEFNMNCKQLGIVGGVAIKSELSELLNELPDIYDKIANKAQIAKEAVDLYCAFVRFHTDNTDVLPLLNYIINIGNTTVYQFKYGKKPIAVNLPIMEIGDDNVAETGIDFGESIDFGECDAKDIHVLAGDSIDWSNDEGFEIVEHSDLESKENGIVLESTGVDGGIACGKEAFTILDSPTERELFMNDLAELESFLLMRMFEMSSESDLLSISQLQDAPTEIQMQTLNVVENMLFNVKSVIGEMSDKRTQHLHNMKHSPKYIDILTASLNQKLAVIERLKGNVNMLNEKMRDAVLDIKNIQTVINLIIEKTKLLQQHIEEDISKRYKGRPVHIVGAVNSL